MVRGDAPAGRSGTFVCDLVPDLVHAPKAELRRWTARSLAMRLERDSIFESKTLY